MLSNRTPSTRSDSSYGVRASHGVYSEVVFKTYLLDLDSSVTSPIDDETELPTFGLRKLRSFATTGAPLLLSCNVLVAGDKKGYLWLYDTRTGNMIYELQGGNSDVRCITSLSQRLSTDVVAA